MSEVKGLEVTRKRRFVTVAIDTQLLPHSLPLFASIRKAL